MKTQKQKRFHIVQFKPAILTAPRSDIMDGYWETSPGCINRIRIQTDHLGEGASRTTARLTTKYGVGTERPFKESPIDTSMARLLLETCPYRVKKVRYRADPWKLDVFGEPLNNLVWAEIDVSDADTNPSLPFWISEAREITGELTNYHLARLAEDLRGIRDKKPFEQLLARMPKIVITGGPCSGKSTLMELLKRDDRFHCVPEVATIIISLVGAKPPLNDDVAMRRFQRNIFATQHSFEEASEAQAFSDGRQAMVTDRGVCDNAAYLPGGLEDLEKICRTNADYELSRYDLVVHLDVPEKGVYDASRGTNAARREDWTEAAELGLRVGKVWSRHRKYRVIGNRRSMSEKIAQAVGIINDFLNDKTA